MPLMIEGLGPDLADALDAVATERGASVSDVAKDLIAFGLRAGPRLPGVPTVTLSPAEIRRRAEMVDQLRSIRAMTLEPLQTDSTLLIREMRDTW